MLVNLIYSASQDSKQVIVSRYPILLIKPMKRNTFIWRFQIFLSVTLISENSKFPNENNTYGNPLNSTSDVFYNSFIKQ